MINRKPQGEQEGGPVARALMKLCSMARRLDLYDDLSECRELILGRDPGGKGIQRHRHRSVQQIPFWLRGRRHWEQEGTMEQ